ncbi:MAG: sulfur transferase domain-containing protein [Alteromonadaceae bacterium]|jgi:uncharacterized protein (TIGR01244 family)
MMNQMKVFTAIFILIISLPGYTQQKINIDKISAQNTQQFTPKFIVGGQPSEIDLVILSKSGIKTIINLRGDEEFNDFDEKAEVEALGMNYITIPILGASGINNENLKLFSAAIQNKEQAFVHCASGNRVGAMFALDAYFNHKKSLKEAISIGKQSGLTRLESTVKKVIMAK